MTKDLRSFLADAKEAGVLEVIDREVDPRRNIGVLCDESQRTMQFTNIAGYPGWTAVANLASNRDIEKVIFGVKERSDVVRALAAAIDAGPSPHVIDPNPPCQEVVWEGEDANLSRLPIVQHSELDGGPYIGSGIGVVVDPETGYHNSTWPRLMIGDGKNCPFLIFSPHVGRIAAKYAQMGKPMPMAIAIGNHPAVDVAASLSIHHPGCGELDFASSLLGEPMKFAKCTTVDVDVPSHSEIVIEGETIPNYVQDEGPFGNYLGTYSSGPLAREGVQKAPVFKVKRITMRKNAIYRHLQSTVFTEHQRLCMLPMEAVLFNSLQEMGLDIHDIHLPSWGGCSATIIQMTPRAAGEAQDALLKAAMWENTTLSFMSQLCIAVNKDVDIYDARDVLWALAIRTNWAEGATVIPGTRASPLMPLARKVPGVPYRLAAKSLVNATVLPPREDQEWWEQNRAWPMGKGKFSLTDFVPGMATNPFAMRRLVDHQSMLGLKPSNHKPQVPE